MTSIKQAIVLAGGKGTRLRSVVSDLPKPMAPVAGRPFLEFVLDQLSEFGITHVVLSVGYKHELIESHFGREYSGMKLIYAVESEPLGTGGGILFASTKLPFDTDFFLLNGDTLYQTDLNGLEAVHITSGAMVTIAIKQMQHPDRYGTVEVDGDKVLTFREKQTGLEQGWINAGIYVINKNVFSGLIKTTFSFEEEVLQNENMKDKLAVYRGEGYFIDIGIPDDYAKANEDLKKAGDQ